MKGVLSVVLFLLFVATVSTTGRANEIVIGTADTGDCYPFTCNDSGITTGESIQYQQVYSASSFPGTVNITSESFYYIFATQFGGDSLLIGGTYQGFLSTTSAAVDNLSSTSLSSNVGPDNTEVFDFTISPGGELIPSDGIFTIDNLSGFMYNPADGNLLLDVIVTNQDDVPNNSGNAYLDADDTGTSTSQAFAFNDSDSGYAQTLGLVTGFTVTAGTPTTVVPEPSPLVLIATGLLGITALVLSRRKRIFAA